MEEHQKELFGKMGFNMESKGSEYFFSAIEEVNKVTDTINNCDEDDQMKNNLFDYVKRIMLEEYHFFFEIGRKQYVDELYNFIFNNNIKDKKYNKKFLEMFSVGNTNIVENESLDIKESFVILALVNYSNYFVNKRDKDIENSNGNGSKESGKCKQKKL